MNQTPNRTSRRTVLFAWLSLTAVLFTGGGFVVGYKWPIETVTHLFEPYMEEQLPTGWSAFATTELPRYESLKVRRDSMLYVIGGFYSAATKASPRVESLNLRSGAWTRLQDMPVSVTHANAVLLHDTVWIAGGFEGDHPGPATSRVWRYATATDTWAPGPPLPEPRGSGTLVAYGDTLHFFGGYLPDRNSNSSNHWVLAPGAPSWESVSPFPVPRGHLSSVAIGNYLYAIGGSIFHDPVPLDVNIMQRFDVRRAQWDTLPSTPLPISHAEPATVLFDGKIVVVGGRSRAMTQENRDDIFLFEPDSARWTHIGHTPKALLGGVADIYGDTLIVGLGAETGNNPENPKLWRRSLRDSWWAGTTMPVALGEVAAGIIGSDLFVVGEGSGATLRYDIASGQWDMLTSGSRPAVGDHHAAEVVDGKLLLFGGFGGFSEGQLQIFEPKNGSWSLGPRMPFAAGASASARIGDQVFVAGGIVENTTVSKAAVLNTRDMTWTSIADLPRPRNHAASGTDGTRFYVFGGRGPGSGDGNEVANGFDDVQIYDPASGTWTVSDGSPNAPKPMPVARGGTGKAVYLNGEFWVIGGETLTGEGASKQGTYSRVDIYNPVTNSWRLGAPLPTARHGIFPVAKDGRLFVAGGGESAGFARSAVFEVLWPTSINR